MKYNDFSSLVQLGVGLHVGTAFLQMYGEFGTQPLIRTISRIERLLPQEEAALRVDEKEELEEIISDLDIFKIRLFKDYQKYVGYNSLNALLLIGGLVFISFCAEDPLEIWLSVAFTVFSILPAPLTLAILWIDASAEMRSIKQRADKLEEALLNSKPTR